MVSDASKKKAAAAKRGGKSAAAASSKAAASAAAADVQNGVDKMADMKISDRTCTGVLCSHPLSRDIRKKQNKNEGEKKNDGNGGGKKEDSGLITVVFKVDLHCKGCGYRVVKYLKGLDGVTNVKADSGTNKVTVIGKVDPSMLREELEQKTKKKVELLSPAPKKDKKNDDGGGDKKAEKKQDKKPKEVTTVVLKIDLRCAGCNDNIQLTVSMTKGVESKSIDKQKNLVTVTGTMDVKALLESPKDRLKRPVEIVPPKKDAGGGGGGGKKKAKDGDKKADGGGKKEKGVKAEENCFRTGYAPPYFSWQQMFSDENPNACSVM